MESPKKIARITGLLGVVVLICGTFTHSVNSDIIVYQDPLITAKNLIDSESLFRLAFVSSLIMETVFIFYVFNLYRILKIVKKEYARVMLILGLVAVPLFMFNQLNQFAALLLAPDNIDQMMFFLELHKNGGLIVSVFFGLWLFPLGFLVYKSQFLPRILGIFLMIGCFGYLVHFFQGYLIPNYESSLWTNPFLVITHISELLLMCWLVIKGVNAEKWRTVKGM